MENMSIKIHGKLYSQVHFTSVMDVVEQRTPSNESHGLRVFFCFVCFVLFVPSEFVCVVAFTIYDSSSCFVLLVVPNKTNDTKKIECVHSAQDKNVNHIKQCKHAVHSA